MAADNQQSPFLPRLSSLPRSQGMKDNGEPFDQLPTPPFSQRCCTVLLAVSEQRADGNGRCVDHLLKSASRSTHIRLLHSSDVARTGLGTAVKRVVRKHAPSLNCLSVCVRACGVNCERRN